MKGSKWLSESVNIDDIKSGFLNIIESPCGSGKTTFALRALPEKLELIRGKCLYLIDTINGREQILKQEKTAPNNEAWEEYIANGRQEYEIGDWMYGGFDENNMVVMTYAAFGAYTRKLPYFGGDYELIICDELHSGVDMTTYSKNQYYNNALLGIERLKSMIALTNIKVVALTATPTKAAKYFKGMVKFIDVDKDVRQYTETNKYEFRELNTLLKAALLAAKKGIIYESSITQMRVIKNKLERQGIKAIPVWSLTPQKEEDKMDDEQLKAREYIIKGLDKIRLR